MQYAQGQEARALSGFVPSSGHASAIPVTMTLSARLEKAAAQIRSQCERIENTLSKINGTPPPPGYGQAQEKSPSTAPLGSSVENMEMLAKRLCELASNLEQVA